MKALSSASCMAALIQVLLTSDTSFGQSEPVVPGVPALIQQLRDKGELRQDAAIEMLSKKGIGVIPTLIDHLSDPNPEFRANVACTLSKFGSDAIPHLVKVAETDTGLKQLGAISTLNLMHEEAKPAVPTLIKLSTHRDEKVRAAAARALGGTLDRRAIPALLAVVDHDQNDYVREEALSELFRFGEDLRDYFPKLIKIGTSVDPDYSDSLRSLAAIALAHAGKLVIPEVVRLIEDPKSSRWARSFAISCIRTMGHDLSLNSDTKGAIPCLIRVLAEKDNELKLDAVEALRQIGPIAKEAIPALEKLFKSDSRSLCLQSLNAVLTIDQSHRAAMAALIRFFEQERNVELRVRALDNLREFAEHAGAAVPMVLMLLDDPDANIRMNACYFFAYRADGKIALSKLVRLAADDSSKSVREAANDAVERLTKQKPPKK